MIIYISEYNSRSNIENCSRPSARMNINKIVLKGSSKMSLHERFTQLSKFQPAHLEPEVEFGVRGGGGGVSRYSRGVSQPLSRDLSPARLGSRLGARRPTSVPYSPRPRRDLWGPSPSVTAAARIKKRSIQQRLGVKARLSLPRRGWGGLRGWDSEESLNSTDNTENRSAVYTSLQFLFSSQEFS